MPVDNDIIGAQDVFQGGGDVGVLMRAHDWTSTPLGSPSNWPRSLQSIVRMMLTSRYQMWMAWGPDLTFFCNDAYRPTLGVKYPWAIGQSARVVWAEIWPDIGPLIDHVLRTGDATYSEGMLLLLERSGFKEETYHTFSYSPLFDDAGAIAGMFCVVVEETERVINERRLETLRKVAQSASATKTEDELFHAVTAQLEENRFDLPFTLSYLFDEDGAAARLVARSGIGRDHPLATDIPNIAHAPWPVEGIASGDRPAIVEAQTRHLADLPTGAWDKPPEKAMIVPFAQQTHDTAAAGFMIVGLNPYRAPGQGYEGFVTLLAGQIAAALANSRAYEEERKRAEALAEIDRAKTAFFSNVSHEFRTPLTLMLGPLEEILAASGPADGDAVKSQVELAHRNGVRLLRLVNSLLDFSRIEAGRVQARFVPTDLAAFSAEIASSFRSAMEKAGLELTIRSGPLPEPVYLDRDMWEKILLNLLSNAFKFTFDGGVSVDVGASTDGKFAELRVRDTGIGVAEAELPRLFERFHRIEGAQGRTFEGSGIGLALVQELVKLHGGMITAESTSGVGTTFIVRLAFGTEHLPQDSVGGQAGSTRSTNTAAFVEEALRWLPEPADIAGEAGTAALIEASENAPGSGMRVVLADDNVDMRDYVRRLLQAQGYTVDAVGDGEEALTAARASGPDLILSDVMMPRLDGFGLLRAIRDDVALAGTPVILLSARAGEEAKIEGLDAGADDYLIKPFAARELLARVSANIQMARMRREAAREVMRSEQRFLMTNDRLGVALSSGGIAVFDLDIEAQRAIVLGPLTQFFGVSEDAAAQGLPLQTFAEGIDPADRKRVLAAIAYSIGTGEPYEIEYRVIGGDRPRRVVARGGPRTLSDGTTRFIGAVIDISREKEAEEKLRLLNISLVERVATEVGERLKAEDALRQAQKMEAVGQLTGGVAHDFNNLLTIIIGGLDTIRRSGPKDNARLTRAVDMATQGAQRAATLTARLLAFSRRQPLEPTPLDLNVVVRDSTELLHRTLGETIELEGVLAPRLWPVEVDQNQLESAILNLAVNARDAMPDGGKLTIETANTMLDESYTATDSEVVPGQYAVVSITDSGHGMPKEVIDRVFEPFYTTKEAGKGTGLGLSMVYGFVKQSGGHVTIYSEQGQGTTVKLYFPRYRGETPEEGQANTDGPVPGGQHDEVVLVVEDNDDVRSYSIMILNELGYRVLEAGDAEAAIKILRRQGRIDLLFTDVVLPGRTGRMLADEAITIRPDLRVLFTTGYSRNAIVHQGRLDPGVQLITKPFTFDQLAARIRDVLDS
jgi:signal transduction histidine kinase/DNA-binding response OmpR family regulator